LGVRLSPGTPCRGRCWIGHHAEAQLADGALVVGAENRSALAGDRAYDLCRYDVLQREWIRAGFIASVGLDMLAVGGPINWATMRISPLCKTDERE
jgi:hypothetical protein